MAAMKEGLTTLKTNPFSQVDIKEEEIIREFLEPHEIELFRNLNVNDMDYVKNMNTHSKTRTKIQLAQDYFLLCYDLGVRHSDLIQLAGRLRNAKTGTLNDKHGFIDFKTRTIGQKHVKTGQLTFIEVNDNAWDRLESYNFDLPYASSNSVNYNLKKIAEYLGINKSVHIHMTNHSVTTNLHEMGVSIEDIAVWQGKDVKTVRKHYIQKEKFRVSQKINQVLNKKPPSE
jgi:site-specific recombinase XerD